MGRTSARDAVRIGLVTPHQGAAGLFGLSCRSCAGLAVAELHEDGGLLGREVELVGVDGSESPAAVADTVGRLVAAGEVDAVVGWHISAVRRAVAPRVAGRVPYVYTALYEGGERTPGVLMTGETPTSQLRPALDWASDELGVRRWSVVGNDYVWPRLSTAAVRSWVRTRPGAAVVGQHFVPLGRPAVTDLVRAISADVTHGAQGVLMFLVGQDAVAVNRAFAAAGLDRDVVRLSPLMDENMLLASGPSATRGLFVASGYFGDLPTEEAMAFAGRYTREFGVTAPAPSSLGESCYEGLALYAALVRSAGTTDPAAVLAASEGARWHGPRGEVVLRDAHAEQDVYLAAADGVGFDVVARLGA